jgi:hypothetical protein
MPVASKNQALLLVVRLSFLLGLIVSWLMLAVLSGHYIITRQPFVQINQFASLAAEGKVRIFS